MYALSSSSSSSAAEPALACQVLACTGPATPAGRLSASAAIALGSGISPRRIRNSSLIVLAQNTTAKTANNGHSNVYAQLSPLPASARWNCQSPSQSMPQNETTMSRCQPSQRGLMRKCHTGPESSAGASVAAAFASVTPAFASVAAASAGPAFSMP